MLSEELANVSNWWRGRGAGGGAGAPAALAVFFSEVNVSPLDITLTFRRSPALTEGFSVAVPITVTLDALNVVGKP